MPTTSQEAGLEIYRQMLTISITNWSDNVNFDPGYTKHVHNHLTQILQFNSKCFESRKKWLFRNRCFSYTGKPEMGRMRRLPFLLHWGKTQILTQKQSRPEMTAIIKTNYNVHVASVHITTKKENIGLHDLSSKENFAHHICSTSKTTLHFWNFFVSSIQNFQWKTLHPTKQVKI